ncbi:MAG: tripartite tricarboxylate transporter substrate binding protein [Xanthobacteraceae bacterium]|nr:tripartite tricarboxylate transporter substrate binding protein [Xanthobacteraceae bacterium]
MRWFIAALGALVLASQASAQGTWPQRAVTLVVPFGAGGSADLTARILATHLQSKFGAAFVIDNKGGAGGSLGAGFVAKAPNDGYTLLVGTISSNAINAALYPRLPYDLERDFQPVTRLVLFPNLLFVNPKLPARSVSDLIGYLKANPGKANYGSSGIGTSSHLSVVMFALATGTEMTHIPFRSTSEVVNSMIGGNIDLGIDSMTTTIPFAQSGAVRALAVTTPKRSPTTPNLPTIGETLPGYEATAWQGIFAPAGTPRPIVDRLADAVKAILERPDVAAQLAAVGAEPAPQPPDDFAAFARAERAKWKAVVQKSGTRIE